jgi:hypothetical protein
MLAQAVFGKDLEYTKDGKMIFPKNYRDWTFLTAGLGMTYGNGPMPQNPNFDNVFVNTAAYKSFLKTGTWPDKTVLILEIRTSDSKASINKNGFFQTKVSNVEAHVKDKSKGGWAFYGFPTGTTEATMIPKTRSCYTCHEQNASADTTFVQFYPTLAGPKQ